MLFGQEAAYETWKDHRPQVPAAGHRALIVFLTADILWQLLCGRPPFSMWGFCSLAG